MLVCLMFVGVGMAVREVGGRGTGRCGVWMVNDLCLFSFYACAIPTSS